MKLEFFTIEKRGASKDSLNNPYQYRFRSLFNQCVGSWTYDKEDAIKDGESHKKLLCVTFPNLIQYIGKEADHE